MGKLRGLGKAALVLGLVGAPAYGVHSYFKANPIYEDIQGRYSCKLQPNKCAIMAKAPYRQNIFITYGDPYRITVGSKKFDVDYNWYPFNTYVFRPEGMMKYGFVVPTESGIELQYERPPATFTPGLIYKYQCKPKPPERSSVFIRPCVGQFYESFGGDGEEALAVGGEKDEKGKQKGRTVREACEDLRDSGITDIFLAFKTDHEWKGCGFAGNILYQGDYQYSELDAKGDGSFIKAHERDFDPVGTIIDECTDAYKDKSKKLRIHAWVPIFKDRIAAKKGGQKGTTGLQYVGPLWDSLTGKEPDCESDIYAEPTNEDVVDYLLEVLEDIHDNYGDKLAGISLDYIRYAESSEECSVGMYENDTADTVHTWVVDEDAPAEFAKKVKEAFPGLTISANIMPEKGSRESIGQEKVLDEVDMLMPMIYTRFRGGVTSETIEDKIEELRADYPDKKIVVDVKAWVIPRGFWEFWLPEDPVELLFQDIKADIEMARGADGFALFTYDSLINETGSKTLNSIKTKIGLE